MITKKPVSVLEVGFNTLQGYVGKEIRPGVTLLTEPTYNGKWTALANVCGALCLIEVTLWSSPVEPAR